MPRRTLVHTVVDLVVYQVRFLLPRPDVCRTCFDPEWHCLTRCGRVASLLVAGTRRVVSSSPDTFRG
ncbi:hypothetical protein GCM10009566_39110 [Streptomyces murinus]